MANDFNKAAEFVRRKFEHRVVDGKLIFPVTEMKRFHLMLREKVFILPEQLASQLNAEPGYQVSEKSAVALVEECERDKAAFDLCCDISADFLMSGRSLPVAFRAFIAAFITGKLAKPKGTRHAQTWARNLAIYGVTRQVSHRFGLTLTRNDASKERASACDAVEEGLRRAGHAISYRAIKELSVGAGPENVKMRDDADVLMFKLWLSGLDSVQKAVLDYHNIRVADFVPPPS